MDGTIVKGTTPTIEYFFNEIKATDITSAYLTVKESGKDVIERDISTSTVDSEANSISWTLMQEETLPLNPGGTVIFFFDWLLVDGTRGRGEIAKFVVSPTGKNEVIE